MRILAIFAFSFSGAVFLANYLLPEGLLLPGGGLLALLAVGAWLVLRRRTGPRRFCTLLCAGLSLGLLWTAAYSAVFFGSARELDGRTVRLSATVADWPQSTDYGYSVLVRADTDSFVRLSVILYLDAQGTGLSREKRSPTTPPRAFFSGPRLTAGWSSNGRSGSPSGIGRRCCPSI